MSQPLVIQTSIEAKGLLRKLKALPSGSVFGLDVETHGCNPGKESPVGRGEIVCWSIGWMDPPSSTAVPGSALAQRAFLWVESLPVFRDWLEDSSVAKVGHNLVSYDKHIFANHGITLRGVQADTLRLSRLLRASKTTDHSLKGLMRLVGRTPVGEYKALFSRRVSLGEEVEDKHSRRKVDGVFVPTVLGRYTRLGAGKELIDLRTIREYTWLLPTLYDYASLDAIATLEIYLELRKAAEQSTWRGLGGQTWGNLWTFYETFWQPLLDLLWDMEREGIALDAPYCLQKLSETGPVAQAALESFLGACGKPDVNPASSTQLPALLYDQHGFPVPPICGSIKAPKKTKKGKRPADQTALDWLKKSGYGNPWLDDLLTWRKTNDLSKFLKALPTHCDGAGRLHSILAPDTDTGRLSSKKPNLQNIPKEDLFGIRRAFVAKPGCKLVCADFAQLEMVVLAHFLVELFGDWSLANDLAAGDSHSATARRCWPWLPGGNLKEHPEPRVRKKRDDAKTLNYAINYGKTAFGLGVQITDEAGLAIGTDAAAALLATYFNAYPAIGKLRKHCFEMARTTGVVRTLLGRTRPLLECRAEEEWVRASGERKAINTPIQGSAADIVVAAMLKLRPRLLPLRARMVLQIHDEIIVEAPAEAAEEVLQEMVQAMTQPFRTQLLRVPLTVDAKIGNNWQECK